MLSLDREDLSHLEKAIRKKLVARNMDELYAIIDQVGIVGLFHSKYLPSVSEIVKVEAERPSWVGWGWINKLHYENKRVIQATFLATGNISIVSTRNLPYYYVSLKKEIGLDELDKRILSFLRDNGATSRRDLRRAMGVRGKVIGKSIKKLDSSLLIVRAGIQQPKSGWVSRIWDLWENFIPREVMSKCSSMNVEVAKKFVIEKYLLMRGPVTEKHVSRLFRWSLSDTKRTLEELISEGKVVRDKFIKGSKEMRVLSRFNLQQLALFAKGS